VDKAQVQIGRMKYGSAGVVKQEGQNIHIHSPLHSFIIAVRVHQFSIFVFAHFLSFGIAF
jgi:hypothetical protein